MKFESKQFKEYFLGVIPDEDAEVFEHEIISNAELYEVALSAESELIDEFLDGELSDADRTRFMTNYLVTDARNQKIVEARLYRSYFQSKNDTQATADALSLGGPSFFEGVFAWFSSKGLVTAGAIAVLLLIGTVALFVIDRKGEDIGVKYAALNTQDMSDLKRFAGSSKLSILPGTQRGSGDDSKLKLGVSPEVLIRLSLLPGAAADDRYKLDVLRGTASIYSQEGLRSYDSSNGREMRIILPTVLLERGDYQIVVTSTADPTQISKYSFKSE